MADKPISLQKLVNADKDADTLEQVTSADKNTTVVSRLGRQYPSLAKALQTIIDAGGFKPFSTETELKASVPVIVPSAAYAFDTKKIWLWNGSAWVDEGTSALDQAKELILDERNDREALIDQLDAENGLVFFGSDYFEVGRINQQEVTFKDVVSFQNSSDAYLTIVGNDNFIISFLGAENGFTLQKAKQYADDQDVINLQSAKNYTDSKTALTIIDTSQPLIWCQPLCAFSTKPFVLNVPSLFAQRKEQCKSRSVIATFSGQSTQLSYSSRDQINVPDLSNVGTGFITLRDTSQYQITRIPFTARIAQITGKSAVSPKILMIGDSITNRGLVDLINQYLVAYTYTPTYVGTMKGALNSETSTGTGAQNCEAREGWETGDYTYLITDRAQIVVPGNEAAYLAMAKDTQREYNPFLRTATGSDDSSIIRNGYVLDFAFYQSRFSLSTPTVVVIQLGTNDIRDRDEPILAAQFYSEMKLLIQRIRAAWTSTKIILSLPNTPAESDRDSLWQNEYVPVIRKLMQLRADFASDGKIFLCPAWALTTSEAGYSITTSSATTDALSGALVGSLADNIHPQYVARYQLAHVLSAYIACAADNII